MSAHRLGSIAGIVGGVRKRKRFVETRPREYVFKITRSVWRYIPEPVEWSARGCQPSDLAGGSAAIMSRVDKLNMVFRKDPNIVSRQIAGEVILVPVRRRLGDVECIYALNEVASHVWERLDGDTSLEVLLADLVAKFEVSTDEAERDLLGLVEHLKEAGAIEAAS